MALRYPWSVLEISPTNDAAEIRKAYAVKLRVTRPDEDPTGFQVLREARDAALAECRYVNPPKAVEVVAPGPSEQVIEPAVDHMPMPEPIVEPPDPDPTAAADVGTVNLSELLEASGAMVDDESPDIAEMLDGVGKAHPWRDLKAQWSELFDAMEADALSNHDYNMWTVLPRLLEDIKRQAGELPDVSNWQVDPRGRDAGPLGDYAAILRDFESRFGILNQDTVLLEYLSEEDARDFLSALTIAVGREATPQPSERPVINVEPIEPAYVEAAWGDDLKMLDYYREARAKDSFPWSFSWLALFFPLPFALYYRLTGLAALIIILVAATAAFHVMRVQGMNVPYGQLASTVYLITAGALAFNWRRIRVQALVSRVHKLTNERRGSAEIQANLKSWGQPNSSGLWVGTIILIAAGIVRVLAR
jgi:hypothetical protein